MRKTLFEYAEDFLYTHNFRVWLKKSEIPLPVGNIVQTYLQTKRLI
jgi:hypothetical protein